MARKSYFLLCPRGFANEFTVGIATTDKGRALYDAQGFEQITRKQALRELAYRGDNATQDHSKVTINGKNVYATKAEVLAELKTGGDLPVNAWHAY